MRRKRLLERSPFRADGGELIGRDPRTIPTADWSAAAIHFVGYVKAIREKCIDCAGGNSSEVRKCVQVDCPLWPLRMGVAPKALRASRGPQNAGSDRETDPPEGSATRGCERGPEAASPPDFEQLHSNERTNT